MTASDHVALARGIVDAGLYMVLGTADAHGRPWVSPVYFASQSYREYFWGLRPGGAALAEHRCASRDQRRRLRLPPGDRHR